MSDLVSVAFSSYNQVAFVREALGSVLAQDHDPLQVVVLDDGSTDGTQDVVRHVVDQYDGPHEVVLELRERNHIWSSFATVMARCDGDWIVVAHGDDVAHPTRVSRLLGEARRLGVAMVTSNAVVVDEDGEPQRYWRDPDGSYDCSLAAFARAGQSAAEFGAGQSFDRRVWDEFGPRRKGPRNIDGVLAMRAALLGGGHFDPEPTMLYRQRAGQTSMWSLRQHATDDGERRRIDERNRQNRVANLVAYIDLTHDHLERHPDDDQARAVLPVLADHLHRAARALCHLREDLVGTDGWIL